MSIIYSLIAREETQNEIGNSFQILVELSDSTGNFPQITREVVLKNVPKDQRSIYVYKNSYVFHTIHEQSFVYLCLTDVGYPKSRAQSFLDEVREAFIVKYSFEQRLQAIAYGMNDGFSPILKKKMDKYNESKFDPKTDRIRKDAEETLNLMEINLDSVMDRGSKIELLVKKAQTFNTDTSSMRQRAEVLKEKNNAESFKKGLIAVGSIFAFLYFVVFNS